MRLVIALALLLTQFRPLAGAVVCLHETRFPAESCSMGDHAVQPVGHNASALTPGGEGSPDGCKLTSLCAASVPALIQHAPFALFTAPDRPVAPWSPAFELGESRAPPHNPPIA